MPNQDAINAMRQYYEPRPTGPSQYQPASPQNLGNTYGFDNMQPQPYPGYTPNRFWDSPERLTRYLDAAAAIPEGAETPDWLSKAVPVLTEARSYFEKANPGKSWWEWSELADDDPMKQALRTLAPPPTYAMYDEEQGEDWYNIPRGGAAGTMETGTMPDTPAPTTGGGGGSVPAGYQPAENVTENRIFGYTQEAWDALPKEQQLMMQIMPAVQRGMAVASGVVIGAGVAGPVGAVAGGLGGLGLAVGAEKNPGLAKAMSVLDLPREALERTMGVLYQGYAEGLAAYKDGGMDASQDAVADVLNNLPAAWKAAHEFYNIALAGSTVDAEGNRVYGGVFSNDPNNKRVIYGTEGAQEITAGNTMRELQAMREAIANGTATPEQVYADLEARYGAGGMMREIVSGFALDPLNVLPGSIKDVGSGLAGKLGNAPLKTALESNKTLLGGIQEYGTALRQLPIEEASHYGVVSKWLAGLDDTGQIKDYAKVANEPNKLKAAFNYLTGLTPMARATEVVNNSAESLKLMLGEDNLTDIETYQTAKALTSVSVEGVVDGAETTRLPKYFTSAEAQPLALALRSKGKEVDAIWDRYRMARPQAEMLQRMAKVMERSDAELLDTLKAATPEDADLVLREFKAALKARADGGDKDAGAILEGIGQDRNMTGATLKRWADAFKRPDGPAYNKSILQMQLVTMFEEGVEKWTVDWFGVKPQHWFFRMNDVMKKAQSYLLLGLSPSYFMNNAINNLVTTGWDGLLSFHTAKARKNMLAEFGIQPSRFSAANTAADVADNTGGRILREASTQPGNLQAVSDFLDKGRKIQVASRLSQVSERFSGENAMLTAMLQYWSSHWKPGKGFDKLPQGLRNVLEQVQPGLSKKIENAVSGSKNRAAVEKAIFAELGKRRVTDLFTPDDRETLAHFPGLLDGIERGLDKATTQEQRRQVFQDARTSMEKQIDADVARNVRRLTEETTNRVVTEGVQSVIDMGYQIAEARADMHWQHRSRLDDLWRSVQGKRGYKRRMILENGLRAEDRLWNAHQNVEGARILGMVKGLGADDPQMLAVERSLMDQHDLWSSYFAEKRRMIEEFYNTTFDDDAASSAAWRALNDKLDDMYIDRLEGEAGAQAIINGVFADAGEAQFPGSRAQFEEWTSAIQHQHEQIGEAVRYFRTGKSKAIDPDVKKLVDDIRKGEKPVDQVTDPAVRDVLWKEFNQRGYNVLVRRQLDAVNGGSARILNEPGSYARAIQQGKAEGQVPKANAQPAAVPVMVTQNMKRQLADLGYSAEDVRLMKPQDAWDIINAQTAKAVDAIIESAPNTDSRQNSWLRKAIDEMDFEERGEVINWLRNRIMTDERTGMKNMVAYLEAERKPNAVAVDITGLKTVNDTWGEANGDILIKAYAKLLNDITEDSYRLHGDLFLLQADNPAMAAEMLANVQTAVDNLIIEVTDAEGQTHYLTGFDIHGAVGTGYENASAGLKASKPARTATGEDRRLVNRVHEIEPKGEDRGGVAERAVEPEEVSPSIEKQRTAIRERVQEYDPSVTADRHILNIVKKYGGYALTRFDQITTEMVQNAFARRSIERRAAGQASDIDARIVQARVAALEENMTRLELSAPKELTREAWSRDLYDMMPEQADGVIAVTDAIADYWARENGKTRDAWYNTFLLERGGTEMGGDALAQRVLHGTEYEFYEFREGPHGAIYFSEPESRPGSKTQAEHIAGGPFGGRLVTADIDDARIKVFDPYNDPKADEIIRRIYPDWRTEGGHYQVDYTDMPQLVPLMKEAGYNYVKVYEPSVQGYSIAITDPSLAKITENVKYPRTQYRQGLKGSTRWLDNGKAVIHAFKGADVSTIVHEVAHVWMEQLGEADRDIVSRWLKQQGADIADVKGKELFARGFERYLAEGKAPTPKLASVFANFKRWMLDIYKAITGSDIDVKLNDEVRAMFDKWMGKEEEAQGAARPMATEGGGRAPAGGIIGINGEFYPGGTFLPNTMLGKMAPTKARKGTRKIEVAPRQWLVPPKEDLSSIYAVIGGVVPFDRNAGKFSIESMTQAQLDYAGGKQRAQKLTDAYNDGYRMFDWKTGELFKMPEPEAPKPAPEPAAPSMWDAPKAETPASLENIEGVTIKTPKKKSGEVVGKWGFTKDQVAYISEQLTAYARKAIPPGALDDPEFSFGGRLQPAESKKVKPLVIDVDGFKLTVKNYRAAAELHKVITGKDVQGFQLAGYKSGSPERAQSSRAYFTGDLNAALRLYGDPQSALTAIRGQLAEPAPGVDTLAASRLVMELEQLAQKTPEQQAAAIEQAKASRGNYLFQTAPEPRPAIGAPLGIVDGLHLPPLEEAAIEGYMRDIRPLLDRAERAADEPDFDVALPEPAQKEIRRWLGGVYNQMADTKMGMMRYGEARRDFALLNYTRRHGVDNYIGSVMPYQFWYTRSALNWAIRAMTNPAIAANYYRLSRTTNGMQEQEGYPTRLRGKMGIKVPFLPDWMGEGVYIDPYKQAFPFAQMLRPWQKREEDMSMLARKVQSNLDRMIEDEEITPAQYEQAISTHAGQVWQRATAEAERDMDSDSLNMGDFMNTIMSYSLPIEVTRRMMSGEKDKIGQLPVTRTVQNLTAALGIGGARGVNIEAPFRKAMGMPEIDRFEETGINKLIADIVAEPGSSYSAQDALQAMIDREGPIYDEAQRRAGKIDLLKWVGSSLGVDLFPEGEQIQRQLQVEYYNAVEAWKNGDEQAINAFYDKYPEYEARAKAFKDPETQLRTFLISQIWQQYNDMPALRKRETTDQLGSLFMDAFLNKETRSYDSISINQLATWAKAVNGTVPKKAGEVSPYPLKFSDDKDAGAYQDYIDQRKAKWAGIDEVQEQYYALPDDQNIRDTFERQHPELTRYNEWRTRYLGDHLEVVPYVVGEESELYGYPADVQKQVYAYRAAKLRQYPGIDRLQEGYFAIDEIDKVGRRAYLKANPEIEAFWDWQQQQAADHPQAAQFIKSEGWMSEALGNYSASGVPKELQGALDSYYSQKEQAFPDIDQAWQQYMGLDTSARRAYWQQHPELQDYLDWQKIQIAANPGIISYVKSDESIANLVLPEKAGAIYPDDTLQATIARFSSSLAAQMLGAAYAGRSLGSGAKMELKRHYQEAGSPGNYDEWLEAIKAGIAP